MSKSRIIALLPTALAAIALPAASAPAGASPTLNFSIVTNQFSKPTMEFKFDGGKYVWDQKAINTQFKANADTHDNKLLWQGPLRIQTLGVGGSAFFDGKVPEDVKSWSQQGPVTLPVSFLGVYQAGFASYCDSHGRVGRAVVKNNLSILFSASQGYYKKTKDPQEVQQDAGPEYGPRASQSINMPMTVVCGPKPASVMPRPGDVVAEKGDFRVTGIELGLGGMPPLKINPAAACKQAKLTVTVKTSRAGAVRFRLTKKIGDGPMQSQAIDAWAKFDGNAQFVATYHETVSVKKATYVQAKADDLTSPIGLSTPWKDAKLTCETIGGGLAGTPTDANPDNGHRSKLPAPHKRVMTGPTGVHHDTKLHRLPVRPSASKPDRAEKRRTLPPTGAGPHRRKAAT